MNKAIDNILYLLDSSGIKYISHPEYIKLKCIFHVEDTPSLFLYPETNSFFCFGCSKFGRASLLISKLTGKSVEEVESDDKFKYIEKSVQNSNYNNQVNLYLSEKIYEVFKTKGPTKPLLEVISELDIELSKRALSIKESSGFINKIQKKLYNISEEKPS